MLPSDFNKTLPMLSLDELFKDVDRHRPAVRVLEYAIRAVGNERNKTYGTPDENFRNIAAIWAAMNPKADRLTPQQVALLQICVKLSRLMQTPDHIDSLVDLAGYAACAADCVVSIDKSNKASGVLPSSGHYANTDKTPNPF